MKNTFFLPLLIILIHLHLTKAIPMKINNNNIKGCGEECMINMDEEFSLSSHAGVRILLDSTQTTTGGFANSDRASVNCPQNTQYRNCLPSQNGGPTQNCGIYNRIC
ncbi:unnamed protein product [Lupinus luteus]|uniref:Rapid ALkalinization Factor n=1 Tax=Lupinus luteus TaxID=3873 RepID=A0AAV1X6G8_LUPLU